MAEKKTTKEYFRAIGRRKTATAVVRLTKASKTSYKINDRELADYFPTAELKKIVTSAFETAASPEKFEVL
jgi:ribosomal protein S9